MSKTFMPALAFDNTFAQLPEAFYTKMPPEAFAANPVLVHGNKDAAKLLGWDKSVFEHADFAAYFAGNKLLEGSEPLAMAYSGHQFGVWAGQLGDGRALLLGQIINADKQRFDIQLKGAGETPYSRMGDGRAVLRSCIREYLCGEAMHGLGIATTRSLCIVGTNEPVQRETLEPGAILTRVAESHIRFGHFEHFNHTVKDTSLVKLLADHVIAEHFAGVSYEEWFLEVIHRTAIMIAQWQAVGFCHGVMNTDNMSILGLTLDYGPFGFMETYDPAYVCNHSDHQGRYAYNMQPSVAYWNLNALAFALESLIDIEDAKAMLKEYQPKLMATYKQLMAEKLGLASSTDEDASLWQQLLSLMRDYNADYTNTFRALSYIDTLENKQACDAFLSQFKRLDNISHEAVLAWLNTYLKRVAVEDNNRCARMVAVNPKYVLRNWVAETAIRAAEDNADYSVIDDVLQILKTPYQEHPEFDHFAQQAPESLRNLCVSCSS